MKLYKFGFFLFLIVLACCKSSKPKVIQSKGDTTKVLELAIKTAFYNQNLPGMGPLFYSYHFKDSILFTTDSFSLTILPLSLDSFNFKVLPRKQICTMIKADSNISKLPNYLYLGAFEKSDTGYYVSVQSRSCLPFGGGGSIGLYISKEKDTFIVKYKTSSSIN